MRIVEVLPRTVRWPIEPRGPARDRTERTAILVDVVTADGHRGIGEAAPLPDFPPTTDTLAAATAGIAALRARVPLDIEPTLAAIAELAATLAASPSARFAIETALGRAAAAQRRVSLEFLVGEFEVLVGDSASKSPDIPDGSGEPPDPHVASVRNVTRKVKVGAAGDLDRIVAITRETPEETLRVDANRSWPRERVRERLFALAELPVEYVEEPCVEAWRLLAEPLPTPVALDESLVEMSDAQIEEALAAPGLAALVLKPTVLGGLAACARRAARARAAGKLAVVTHALEGPAGTEACRALARAIGGGPHGVDDHPAVEGWRSGARVVVAEPTLRTVAAIHEALAARAPIALLHAKLAPEELARQHALVERAVLPHDTAAILFTSGSTGAPRGVVLSRAALEAQAAASAQRIPWRPGDRALLALSTAHAGGLSVVVRAYLAGVPLEIVTPETGLAGALAHCTVASLVPTQLAMLLEDPAWRAPAQLRAVLLGGAAAPPALVAEAVRRGVPVLATYGLTESFGQLATALEPGGPLVPLPGVEIIVEERLRVRAPVLATCYLDGTPIAPELVTADVGTLAGGTLRVDGRADDVIISGGENVHPAEVEAVLAATPGVREACAFGIDDSRWGQIVGAALAITGPFDLRAAAAHWHARLPPHARPRRIATVAGLPQLPGGKIDRRAAAALPAQAVHYG